MNMIVCFDTNLQLTDTWNQDMKFDFGLNSLCAKLIFLAQKLQQMKKNYASLMGQFGHYNQNIIENTCGSNPHQIWSVEKRLWLHFQCSSHA